MAEIEPITVPKTIQRRYANIDIGTLNKAWNLAVETASIARQGRMDGRTYIIAVGILDEKLGDEKALNLNRLMPSSPSNSESDE